MGNTAHEGRIKWSSRKGLAKRLFLEPANPPLGRLRLATRPILTARMYVPGMLRTRRSHRKRADGEQQQSVAHWRTDEGL